MSKKPRVKDLPSNVNKVLAKLGKSETQLGELFLKKMLKGLNEDGYTDASVWAHSVLPAILNEIGYTEDIADVENFLLNLDGMEKSIAESIYSNFNYLKTNAKGVKHKDLRDTLVYSIAKTLESLDKEKYKKLYG